MRNKPQQDLIRQATTEQAAPPSVVRRRHRTYGNTTDVRRKRPYHRTTASTNSSSSLAAAGGALLLCLGTAPGALRTVFAAAKESISVVTPTTVEAGIAFAVEWEFATDSEVSGTTGDLNPFEIELRWCGEDGDECESSSCGSTYLSLCEKELGCFDSDGSYDVIIPSGVTGGEYVIKVTYLGPSGWASASSLASFDEVSDCSGTFLVENSRSVADEGIPYLEATALETELEAGEAFTARWKYDDGEGNGDGFFEVNLYECNDGSCTDGSCGTFMDSLCIPEGCYDPGMGDYDVRLPATISPGKFKLQVKTVEDDEGGDAISACTNTTFDVVSSPYGATPPPSGETFAPSGAPSPGTAEPSTTGTGEPSTTETLEPSITETLEPSVATASPTPTETKVPTPTPVATTSMPAAAPLTSSSMTDTPIAGVSPTPVPGRANCSSSATLTYSYEVETSGMPLVLVAHESGDRDEGGCATLTGLWEWLLSGPSGVPSDLLHPVNPLTNVTDTSGAAVATGVWLLRTSIDVTNGVLFEVKGTSATGGGDCDRLLLSSSSDLYIRLRGWGGSLYFEETHVTSWVEEAGTEHMLDAGSDGSSPRSYIGCVSEMLEPDQTCDGVAQKDMGLCRMDIMSSVLGYLGYAATESYGITWKVRGLCEDLSNVDSLFETVRVYGNMINCDIHHMWYGMYSYGHLGGVWNNNLMHDNHVYGFDPHDDSDFITIQGNTVWNNGDHGIIASKRCDHLLVKDNESFDNNGSGIMLHRSCDDSTVEGNRAYNNYDAGLSLVETSRTLVKDNEFDGNRWGIRVLAGSNNNTIEYNTCRNNTSNDVLQYIGSEADTPLVAPYTGFNERNMYRRNTITAHVQYTMDLKDSLYTVINNNEFVGPSRLSFLRTNVTRLSDNTGPAAETSPKVRRSCFTEDSNVLPVC